MGELEIEKKSPPERVTVLLVDDNRRWAEFMQSDIEETGEEIDVTLAFSANEVMVVLEERDDIDCIVADYRMPEIDGIQLLQRVRAENPLLPFVLVTGEGSEDIAANAIETGVTDYLVKEPGADQTILFVNKIRTAVEQYRLQQATEENEELYRRVTEQSRDAIGIFKQGRLVFWNRRMVQLTGRDARQLQADGILTEIVHPKDRDRVESSIERWITDSQQQSLSEIRIVQPDGTLKDCEITGRPITYEDERALLMSIRDITERKQHERELKWERELNRNVQEAFVESRTREDLEQAVATQLREHGYELVWIAERDGGALSPRLVDGDSEYVDQIELSISESGDVSEPCLWAAHINGSKFVQDFESLFETDWRNAAIAAGYRSGAGLSLVYNGIFYGLLAVYHRKAHRFDESEQQLLSELAETMAFAIHTLETETALASDHVVDVSITLSDEAYYLLSLSRDGVFVDCDSVVVRGTLPDGDDAVIQYLTVESGDEAAIRDALQSHPDVSDVLVISERDPLQVQTRVTGPVPEAHLAAKGTVVHSTVIEGSSATIDFEVLAKEDVRSLVETLEETFGTVSVRSVVERERDTEAGDILTGNLTEKQATALQAAYHHGYFDQPRKSSATEVAEALDVTHSTFLQHLRTAQRKVFEQQFE